MDPKVREDLEFILEKNLKEIMVKYASYVDCLHVAVKNKEGVTVEDLRSFLLSLPASSKTSKGQQLTLLSDRKHELQECNSITAIFDLYNTTCASFPKLRDFSVHTQVL